MPAKSLIVQHIRSLWNIYNLSLFTKLKKIKYQKMGCLLVVDAPSELHVRLNKNFFKHQK